MKKTVLIVLGAIVAAGTWLWYWLMKAPLIKPQKNQKQGPLLGVVYKKDPER